MPKISPIIQKTVLDQYLADKQKVDGKPAPRLKRTVLSLGDPRGLCIRLAPGKQVSAPCYLTYRLEKNGPVEWMPLGNYGEGEMTLEEIRDAADAALKLKRAGKDPRFEMAEDRRKQTEATRAAKAAKTMKDACNLYLTYAADRTNVKASTERWATALIVRLILPYFGERLVAEVSRDDVKTWHRSPAIAATPTQADGAVRVLSKVFNLALDKGWRTDNPAFHIPKIVRGKAKVRTRIMDQEERVAMFRALRSLENDKSIDPEAAGAIRALSLSAMRLQEVLTLRWDEVDFKKGLITKSDHKTSDESGDKLIAITPELKKVLKAQCGPDEKPLRKGSPWVFPSPFTAKPGEELGHFVGLQRVWDRVRKRVTKDEAELVRTKKKKKDEAVNIEDVHLHDLRRTALSITAGEQNIKVIAAVAGHANTTTTEKVYAHIAVEKMRVGAELIAAAIAKDMEE